MSDHFGYKAAPSSMAMFRQLFCVFLLYAVFVRFLWCQDVTSTVTNITACRPGDTIGCTLNDGRGNISTGLPPSTFNEVKPFIENGRGRAMNFTSAFTDSMRSNGLETGSPIPFIRQPSIKEHSIDDVSMDDMDDQYNMNVTNMMLNVHHFNDMMSSFQTSKNITTCTDLDKVYKLGEKFNKGCDEICQCLKNGIVCSQVCKPPYYTKGQNKKVECVEEIMEGNSCCVKLQCTEKANMDAEMVENSCIYKNESYKQGTTFKDGCESICTCENSGHVSCKNRCRPMPHEEDNCVSISDPKDSCCRIVLCDVEEHVNKMETTVSDDTNVASSTADNQILSVKALNSSSVALTFAEKSKDCQVESSINGIDWENVICVNNIVAGLQPGKKYYFKLKNTASNKVEIILPPLDLASNSTFCTFKGRTYRTGEEFHDGCDAFCQCDKNRVECAPLECPTDFGLDVLDPQCLEWETFPANFTPVPPHCCPEKVHCRFNGSCVYNGETFPNWAELPVKVTGCEKRCFCEMSNVTCQPMCQPVPETPPKNLHCPLEQAILAQSPDNECCSMWICSNMGHTGNESIMPVTKQQTNITSSTGNQLTKPTVTKPTSTDSQHPEPNKDHPSTTKTSKKEFYPGPFSPQYFSKNENTTNKSSKKPTHEILTDLLTPFHLEKFADEIDKDIHSNITEEQIKKPKKPTKTHFKDEEEKESEEDDTYDEKTQDEDLFTDIFQSKNKNKHPINPFWTVKPPEIPELVKNPHPHDIKPFKDKEPNVSKHPVPPGGLEFSKKHNGDKDNNLYVNKKQKPTEDNKSHESKVPDNGANHFIPFANIPYNVPQGIYPNSNPGLKYPPAEILIHHQGQKLNHKFKPPASISDPNQSDEYFHVLDNDAYNENLHHFGGHPETHNHQFQQHPSDAKGPGIRIPMPDSNDPNINFDDVLTHFHNEANNNNGVHLPNIPPGHQQHQIPHVLHTFDYQNYPETLNTDQTSHPLLLHSELNSASVNGTNNQDEIRIHTLEPVDDTTIKLVFSVPAFLVGLHGRIELRYTADQTNSEPSTWEIQILAPPNDLIATKELEFELGGLQPNTTYKIKISVIMRDIDNAPTSRILMIRTLATTLLPTTLPPTIPVEPDLRAIEVNSTFAKIGWRMFSSFELQFIDGVQIRYKQVDDKIYASSPYIHRAVTTYTIEELKPDSTYEVGLYLIPFHGQLTELQAQKTVQIRTTVENDPYKFDIVMEVHHIKYSSVEISWSGIPYPEDKYVNIFRAIYQSDGSREDSNSFKVAKRDSPQNILIQDLKPGTRYRLWLEAYLTNGRIKKSNVKDFITKLGPTSSSSTSQGKLESMALVESSTYYGPLVVVSIVATVAVMSTIILLLVLAKKHGTNKAPITSPINRKNNTSAAYDNPTYKTCENDRLGSNNSKAGSIALTVFPKNHMEKES